MHHAVMKIFLYEFVTGGGWYSYGDEPCPESLVREGRAMVESLGADLAKVEDVSLVVLQDRNLPALAIDRAEIVTVSTRFEELAAFRQQIQLADWTIVIAPELSGFLAQRAVIVEKSGGRLLGPPLSVIRLTSDKHATAERLLDRGIPTAEGIALERGEAAPQNFGFPAVLKPRDGAGSLGVRVISSADEVEAIDQPMRLERYYPGDAVSVSFLCGPDGNFPLVPCRQKLATDGSFSYLGGALPLPAPLGRRAIALASRAVGALGNLCGYLGVDLVLGAAEDGSDDVVIEINPRLTTSYVGLRAAARTNLADAMLRLAQQQDARIVFDDRQVQFDASGRVF